MESGIINGAYLYPDKRKSINCSLKFHEGPHTLIAFILKGSSINDVLNIWIIFDHHLNQRFQTRGPRESLIRTANIRKNEDFKRNIESIGLFLKKD